jgi:LPXTG-site transpeptidase (sortase) family protein
MSESAVPTPTTRAAPRRTGWRLVVHWFGILCLIAAAGFAGYVAWLLWGTGLTTQRAQTELRQGWAGRVNTEAPAQAPGVVALGSRYGELQIPSIGFDMMVVQGTEYNDLKKGPGHYPDTADPWDGTGRVGIAGHRTTYLHPFFELDHVQAGDQITLRTEYGTYVYRVDRDPFVVPEAGSGSVLHQTTKPTLVLTTCNPKYQSYQRLIVTAVQITAAPGGAPQ